MVIIARAIAFVFILGIMLIAIIYFKGSDIVSKTVEEDGSSLIDANIDMKVISLNPFNGVLAMKSFAIGQPPGFGNSQSFSVDTLMVDIKPLSLLGDTVEVETILIDNPTIHLVLEDNESNFGAIEEKLDIQTDPNAKTIKMSVENFYLNNTKVKITSNKFGAHEVSLADIHLTNIGVDEGGVPPKEVLRHAIDAIKPQVGKLLLELGIKNKLSNQFDDTIGEQLNEQLEKLPNEVKDVIDLLRPKKED